MRPDGSWVTYLSMVSYCVGNQVLVDGKVQHDLLLTRPVRWWQLIHPLELSIGQQPEHPNPELGEDGGAQRLSQCVRNLLVGGYVMKFDDSSFTQVSHKM